MNDAAQDLYPSRHTQDSAPDSKSRALTISSFPTSIIPDVPDIEANSFALFQEFKRFQAFLAAEQVHAHASVPTFTAPIPSLLPSGHVIQSSTPVPCSDFPPFIPIKTGLAPLGVPLNKQFKRIPPVTLLQIVRYDFHPSNLTQLVQPRSAALKGFPTFCHLLIPLTVYFEVLAAHAASSGCARSVLAIVQASSAYIRNLCNLSSHYQWPGILAYHEDFFLTRQYDMQDGDFSGWLKTDELLVLDHCTFL